MSVRVTIDGHTLTGGQKLALHTAVLQYQKNIHDGVGEKFGGKLGPTIKELSLERLAELDALLYGRAVSSQEVIDTPLTEAQFVEALNAFPLPPVSELEQAVLDLWLWVLNDPRFRRRQTQNDIPCDFTVNSGPNWSAVEAAAEVRRVVEAKLDREAGA